MNNSISFNATGTVWCFVFFEQYKEKDIRELKKLISEFEKNYSRFIESSLLSTLNSLKVLNNPLQEFTDMLNFAIEYYYKSEGIFDIRVGKILESTGYDKDYSFKANTNLDLGINKPIESDIQVDLEKVNISDNVRIDFGGFGKGWLIKKSAEFLLERGYKYFYINAGGDIFATSNNESYIEFLLEDPDDKTKSIGNIKVKNLSLASSSNNRRTWVDHSTKKIYSHIVNLKNTQNKKATYVSHKDILIADTLSTIIFLADSETISKLYQTLDFEFLIIFEDNTFFSSKNYLGNLYNNN